MLARFESVKHSLVWIAILLVVIWVLARVVLAVTSVALHLLWVVAIIAAIVWVYRRVTDRG
jgi:hypothetical protein